LSDYAPQELSKVTKRSPLGMQRFYVTPTFYKNKFFVHIGVHIKCISNCSTYEKLSKNKYCIGCIAWHGILYFSKILEEPKRI
jgi:hypothetical protein